MIDKQSETWQTVAAELGKEAERVQTLILTRGLSHDESNYCRGYHAALMKIRALQNPVITQPPQPADY